MKSQMRSVAPIMTLLVVLLAGSAGVAGLALVGHGGEQPGSALASQTEWTIEDARAFTEFDLYWLGEDFMGHRLRGIYRTVYNPPPPIPDEVVTDSVSFIYGECIPVEAEERSCAIPLAIHVNNYCTRQLSDIVLMSGEEMVLERGVPAKIKSDGGAILWTGNAAVDLSITHGSLDTESVIASLERLNGEGSARDDQLPGVDELC